MSKASKSGASFEEAMQRLESVVEEMESPEMPLEKIIERYEEGMKLIGVCQEKLQAAEKKIELLTRSQSGEIETSALELEDPEETPGS
jgi:exodeoxyribonuclease VII small subunit